MNVHVTRWVKKRIQRGEFDFDIIRGRYNQCQIVDNVTGLHEDCCDYPEFEMNKKIAFIRLMDLLFRHYQTIENSIKTKLRGNRKRVRKVLTEKTKPADLQIGYIEALELEKLTVT